MTDCAQTDGQNYNNNSICTLEFQFQLNIILNLEKTPKKPTQLMLEINSFQVNERGGARHVVHSKKCLYLIIYMFKLKNFLQ